MEAGGLAWLGNFDSLSAFGKGWCPVGAAERHPGRNAGVSRQSGWCSPVMEANKCPARHRHDSAKKRRGTPEAVRKLGKRHEGCLEKGCL